jgi:hypothetical protein
MYLENRRAETAAENYDPLALQTQILANAQKQQQYMIQVSQRNEKQETVCGGAVIYLVER